MILIFKGFDAKAFVSRIRENKIVTKLVDFAKSNRIKIKYAALSVLGVCLILVALLSAGVTVGFKVEYSGKTIAVVRNKSVYENALNIACKNISGSGSENAFETPKFTLTVTLVDKCSDASGLADTLISSTGEVELATALKVDGEIVAVCKGERIAEYLERRRTSFFVDGADNSAEFVAKTEVEEGYFLKSEVADFAKAKEIIDKLEVKTTALVTTKISVPFATVKKNSDSYAIGYSKVTTAGCNGTSLKTEKVEYINGTVTTRTEISTEVVSKPVDKVVVVGTAVQKVPATQHAAAASKGFICPLNKGSFVISAYYGDGRNHKGIDLAADRGTPIFAVSGGTVTYAGYDRDFGYNVIVQHKDGISTRYAHANALSVSKGQTVSQGDMLGTVGSTGYSTGNHLHFEVIVNGTRVNPAPYIGLK